MGATGDVIVSSGGRENMMASLDRKHKTGPRHGESWHQRNDFRPCGKAGHRPSRRDRRVLRQRGPLDAAPLHHECDGSHSIQRSTAIHEKWDFFNHE
jgi:hypothetical protein